MTQVTNNWWDGFSRHISRLPSPQHTKVRVKRQKINLDCSRSRAAQEEIGSGTRAKQNRVRKCQEMREYVKEIEQGEFMRTLSRRRRSENQEEKKS